MDECGTLASGTERSVLGGAKLRIRQVGMVVISAISLSIAACGHSPQHVAVTATGDAAGAPVGDQEAIVKCGKRGGYQQSTKLVAAYNTTIGDIIAWDNNTFNSPGWGTVVPDVEKNRLGVEPVSVCFVDGAFNFSSMDGAEPNRGALVVDAVGNVWLQVAGFHNVSNRREFPVVRPPNASGSGVAE